jgi:hypothetical protein
MAHRKTILLAAALTCLGVAAGSVAWGQGINTKGWWENQNGQLGSLAPENLNKPRPKAPIDVTGTWMIAGQWQFLPLPKFKPEAQKLHDESIAARKENKSLNDTIGHCWPPGMPVMMTRVWPIHMIQLPDAIVMISNFENQVRWIFMDGRPFSNPDLYVPSYNGESIGHWDGDTLVIESRNFETKNHFIDSSIPVSDKFKIVERIKLINNGEGLQDEFTMTDPENWEGEWKSTKTYRREHKVDFLEVHCLPDLNEGIPSTFSQYQEPPTE